MEHKINFNALVLVGKSALIVPALAMVGVATIGYGTYKAGCKIGCVIKDKISEITSVEDETES